MSSLMRTATVLTSALTSRPSLDLLDVHTLSFTALPRDCDTNLHLNNARYLEFMDLGRLALVARLGLVGPMVQHRWGAVVGAMELEFLKEIPLFARFTLSTRIVGWDHKWVYMEQRFERGGRIVAVGRVQGLFRARRRSVETAEVMAELGPWIASPKLPSAFERLATPSPLRGQRTLSHDDLPGLDWAA
jgi:acyl-CoA thioesterase FadM